MKEIKFKFKIGDIVFHKTQPEQKLVVLTRQVVEGVSGGKSAWYQCFNITGGKSYAEVELGKEKK